MPAVVVSNQVWLLPHVISWVHRAVDLMISRWAVVAARAFRYRGEGRGEMVVRCFWQW